MLKTTQVLEAMVKVTVRKTGKIYRRTMNYAKHVISQRSLKEPKEAVHEYYLREGRGWKPVSKEAFEEATSEEAVKELHKKLECELRERVEREMQNQEYKTYCEAKREIDEEPLPFENWLELEKEAHEEYSKS